MGRRLLMIAYYFPPIKSIGALRNYHVATHLLPFFGKIRVFSTENARILDTENLPISENITVELLPTFDYRKLFSRRKRDKTDGTMHFKEEQKRGIVQWLIKLKFSFPFNFFLDEGAFRYIIAGVRRANRLVRAGEDAWIILASFT